MNLFYEENGDFKVGHVLADNTTSLQVENSHGKRSKIKAANVMLRFEQPGMTEFIAQAEQVAATIDVEFLWEASPPEEFEFGALAQEYFGHAPTPVEAAGALIRLHSSPMHFYKKGKGRYKAAPPEALKAALASAEKKRLQAELQARLSTSWYASACPPNSATSWRRCSTNRTATRLKSRRWKRPAPPPICRPHTCWNAAALCLPRTTTT